MNFSYLILFPAALFILNLWMWLFDNIFHFGENRNKFFFVSIIMGLLSGLSMLLFPKLMVMLWQNQLDFTMNENLHNIDILYYFIAYLVLISILVKILLRNFKINWFFLKTFLGILLIFFLIWSFGMSNFTMPMMIYYLFVVFGEEMLKYVAALNFFERWKIMHSDIITFCIVSALGFAFVENMVYMLSGISGSTAFGSALVIWWWILISRGIIWFLVHTLFTGNIWLFSSIGIKKNYNFFWAIIWFFLWMSLHYIYNLTITQFKISIIFFIVIWYFWISYLFFKSDRLYLNESIW